MVFKIFFNLINIIVKVGRKPGAILLERSEKSLPSGEKLLEYDFTKYTIL